MRTLLIATTVYGLVLGAVVANRPLAAALAAGDDFHQPSMMVDIGQLTARATNLPDQSFDAF